MYVPFQGSFHQPDHFCRFPSIICLPSALTNHPRLPVCLASVFLTQALTGKNLWGILSVWACGRICGGVCEASRNKNPNHPVTWAVGASRKSWESARTAVRSLLLACTSPPPQVTSATVVPIPPAGHPLDALLGRQTRDKFFTFSQAPLLGQSQDGLTQSQVLDNQTG